MPLSKAEFLTFEDQYIQSVAATAGVVRENVKILSINEASTRAYRKVAIRLILATSVQVQTSVLVPKGQASSINQLVLNANLIKNGLPSCTLLAQNTTNLANVSAGTPTSPVSGTAVASSAPIAAIVGVVVGCAALIALAVICLRKRKQNKASKSSVMLKTLCPFDSVIWSGPL